MTRSISLRKVKEFNIPEGQTTVKKADVPVGSIEKSNKTFSINGMTFIIYNCSYSKDISEDISVLVNGDYIELNNYKKNFDFKMYYCKNQNLIFSDSTTPVTKKFFKSLKSTPKIDLKYSTPHFKLNNICDLFSQTKGIGFNSDDDGVNSKSFYGTDVNSNDEASSALESDNSNRVLGSLEIAHKPYTVMFSQSGSIVSFSKLPNEEQENPMLSFALDVLSEINFF